MPIAYVCRGGNGDPPHRSPTRRCPIHQRDPRGKGTSQQRFRTAVLKRDGHQCMALVDGDRCPMTVQLEAAHIVPYSKNGTDDPSNGITLCRPHHLAVDRALFTPPPDDDTYLA